MNWKCFRKPVAIIAALSLVIGLFPAYAVADNVDGGVGGAVAMDVENDKDVVNDKGAGSATEEQAPAAAEKDSVDGKKTPTASEVPQAKGAAKAAPQTRAGETVGLRIWTPGHGTIKVNDSDYGTECQGTWEEGAEVSIEAVPAEGYGFARWLIGQASGNPKLVYASSTKVVAGTDVEAAARFGLEKAPITVAQPVAGTSGSANPPSITVPTGAGYSVTESMWVGENSDLGSLALVTPNTFEAGKTYYMYVKLHDGDDSFASGGAGDGFETELDVTGGAKRVQRSWSQQDGIVLESIIAVTAASATSTHTVTFNTHGANTATPTQQEVEDGGYAAKPANPTKEGFSFLGWFPKEPSKLTRADFSGSNWGGFKFDQVPITGDITLHAAWYADLEGDMYDVTDPDNPVRSQSYYYKGGAASWTSTYQCSSSPITQWYSYSTIQDSEVTMTAHPYDGYEFVCWALNAKPAANEILSTSATYTFTFDGEMTIYGLFQKATHTVSFDTGEGDTVQPQTVAHGGYATAPDRVKWGNYNTMGWHTAADPDTSFDFSNTPIMGDVVLYPNWVLSTSAHAMNKDANYSMGGGTVKRTSDSLVPAMPGGPGTTALTLSAPGSTVSFEAEAAEGFEFVGWTAGTSPTGAIISTEKTLSFTAESTSPTQLFAIFQEKTNPTLTVDCSINSGNVSDAISSVTVNGTALTLSEPDDGLIRPNPTVQGKVDIAPGEDVTVVIAPTDNYTVLGYSFTNISEYTGNMAPDGTTTITFKMPEENAGVSASLARAASVEYDANGGTPTLADWPADNMVKLPMSIAATGTPIDADYFSGMVTPPTGLVFAGLEVTHDSGTSTVDPGDTLSNAKFANGGKIKWLWGGGKTVTFDANGGGGTMDSAQVAEGAEYELPDCTFTAPNANTQAFDKWSVKIGDADAVEKNPGDTITVRDDTVVTATWKDIVDIFVFPKTGSEDTLSSATLNDLPMEDLEAGYFTRLSPGANAAIAIAPAPGYIVSSVALPDGMVADVAYDSATGGASFSVDSLEKGTYIFFVETAEAVTVSFDANAAGVIAPASQIIAKGGKATEPARLTREDSPFHFMYWCEDAGCEGGYIDFATQTFDEDATLYAAWGTSFAAHAYDRTNSQAESGGTVKVKNEEYDVSSAAIGLEGSTFTVKAKPDEGYMLVGWVEGNDPRGTIVNAGNDTYTVENYDGSIGFVHAVFAEAVTVTFDPNGGTIDGSPDKVEQVIEKGGKATKPDNAVKEGFIEPDWYKDGTEFDLNTALYEDTELVARWYGRIKAWVYGVTEGKIYKGGHILATGYASPISEASLPIYEGEPMTLTAVPNDGYRFFGWAESKDGEVIETGFDFVVESYDGSVTRLVALFVKLANITYDVNGGTKGADWKDGEIVDVGTNLSKVLGDTVPDSVPENVAKAPEGKAFCGYRITTDADEQDLLNGEPIDIEITGATTVTYLWRDPTVTIHWSSIDGDDLMDPIQIADVPSGSTIEEALAMGGKQLSDRDFFEKEGYEDRGYRTSKPITEYASLVQMYGDEVSGDDVVNADMDMYVDMVKQIDAIDLSLGASPVCGTEVTAEKNDGGWLWKTQTNRPSVTLPDGAPYGFDMSLEIPWCFWTEGGETWAPFVGTFVGDESYNLEAWLESGFGYTFTNDVTVNFDGASSVEIADNYGFIIGVTAKATAVHVPGEAKQENEIKPSCTEGGSYDEVVRCTACDAVLSSTPKTTEALGHVEGAVVIENEAAPTCAKDGSHDQVVYCDRCGMELSRTTITNAALGHEWGEWVVVKEATEVADGLEQRTCARCGEVEERVIPKTDVEYRCVAGDGGSLTFGSGETLSFIFKRNVNDEASFSHFVGISIDGKIVDKSNYTAKPGSVIVTLEPSFAKTLSVGDHTIEAMFNDGNNAAASFTVTAASEEETTPAEEKPADKAASDKAKESPKTGDTLPMGAVSLTAIAAAAVLAFAWRKRRA